MAIGADLAVDVEVVEQHELPGQGVMVGRHLLGKEAQVRLAVALRHVAEDLVVGAVLLDDVDAVLDRRRVTHPAGDGVSGRRASAADGHRVAAADRAALVDRLRIDRHLLRARAWG